MSKRGSKGASVELSAKRMRDIPVRVRSDVRVDVGMMWDPVCSG